MLLAQVKEGADLIKGVGESSPVLAAFIIIVVAFLIFLFVLLKVVIEYLKSERTRAEVRETERDKNYIDGFAAAGTNCHAAQNSQTDKYEKLVVQTNGIIEKNTKAHDENTQATREVREIAKRLEAKL